MIIKILGTGCLNCQKLEDNAKKAIEEVGIAARIEKVTAFTKIAQYGAMRMPALVIDEQLKISGRIPSVEEIKSLLKND